jgi:predicted porin
MNRQTFVGLSKQGLGTATIGTQYTPMFDVQSITDAAGNNNLVGNAVYSGSLQASTGSYNMGLGAYSGSNANQSVNADTGAYVTRVSNALKLQSERFAGLRGQLFYAQANQNTNQTGTNFTANAGGTNNNTAYGVNADYVWNKLQVVAAYQNLKSYDPSAILSQSVTGSTAGTIPLIANGSADNFGNNTSDSSTYAAATYDFGILKGYAQYITRKAFAVQNSVYQTQRSAYQLGARSQLTPTISAYATYGMGKSSFFQAGSAYANFRTFQIGSDYNLSKRTNLYVAYGSVNQSSDNNGNTSTSAMNYAAGIRHTF